MTRTFIQTDEFQKNWEEMGFTDDDLRRLEYAIKKLIRVLEKGLEEEYL